MSHILQGEDIALTIEPGGAQGSEGVPAGSGHKPEDQEPFQGAVRPAESASAGRDNVGGAVVGRRRSPVLFRLAAVLGVLPTACAPTTAHRGHAPDQSAVSTPPEAAAAGPGAAEEPSPSAPGPAPTTTEAPVTTVTIAAPPAAPATTRRATTTTVAVPVFTVPERVDEDESDVVWLIRQTFPETPDKAVRVARCESGLDPGAVSPDGANWGLLQINVVHKGLAARMGYSWGQMLDVGPNLAVARAVYDAAGGWGPWSCA